VFDPTLEEGRDRHARGIDAGAVLELGQQSGAFDLRLALGAGKGMPAALAPTGLRIAHVDDDGPVTGRPFADVAFHFFSPSPVSTEGSVPGRLAAPARSIAAFRLSASFRLWASCRALASSRTLCRSSAGSGNPR